MATQVDHATGCYHYQW